MSKKDHQPLCSLKPQKFLVVSPSLSIYLSCIYHAGMCIVMYQWLLTPSFTVTGCSWENFSDNSLTPLYLIQKNCLTNNKKNLWSPFISLYVYTVNVFIFLTWRLFTILLVLLVSKFKSNSKIVNHTLFWLWVSLYNFSNYSLFGMDKCSNSQKFMRLAAITVSKTPLSILLLLYSFKIVRHSVI